MEQSPYTKSKPETIQTMFGHIAKQYDRTNAILSMQMHRWWNRQLVKTMQREGKAGILADLCCGTGEIAYTYLRHCTEPTKAYLIDFCEEMLHCAKEKANVALPHELHFIQADVQAIPLPNESVDQATIAYGIRNVQSPQKCIADVYRILKPGGSFGILELTQPQNPVLRLSHKLYLSTALPLIGKWVAANREAYQYLCNSIQNFSKPDEIEKLLIQTGFVDTQRLPLLGGIATIISGKKA